MATRSAVRSSVVSLVGTDPQLSTAEINTLIDLRYAHLYDSFLWSRSLRDFTLTLEAQVSSSSTTLATVTNGDATVTFAGTPITAAMNGEQIQIGTDEQYFFINRTSSSEIELENGEGTGVNWPGTTGGSQTWRVFKTIYALPSTINTVLSLAGEFEIPELDGGRPALDGLDADRSVTNDHPRWWVYAGETTAGVREIELWPAPTQARILRGQGGRLAPTLGDTVEIGFNEALLVYASASDCLNMLHAKTGDESYRQLALFYERKAGEVEKDVKFKDIEKLSPPSTLQRGSTQRLGHDYFVKHLTEEP